MDIGQKLRELWRYRLLLLAIFMLGGLHHAYGWWPTPALRQLHDYLLIPDEHGKTPKEKVYNDLGLYPYRFLEVPGYEPPPDREFQPVQIKGLKSRREAPLVFIDQAREPAFTIINGLLDHERGLHGVLLLRPDGKVDRTWTINEDDVEGQRLSEYNLEPDGLAVFPDGSIIVAFHGGQALTRYDACGRILWRTRGVFHHSITPDDSGHVWTWDGTKLARVRVDDGEVVTRLGLDDIIRANGDSDIIAIRQLDLWDQPVWLQDPIHPNDVDPLTAEVADAFPMFERGDLLVSLRSVNLIFVVDPDTTKIKWWRQGLGRRQHDPDWLPDGRIMFYDNNMHRSPSHIRTIDPSTYEARTIVNGEGIDFYSRVQGKQHARENGAIVVSSPRQGRGFEIGGDGRIVFEFLNRYNSEYGEVGVVSEVRALPVHFFEELPKCP